MANNEFNYSVVLQIALRGAKGSADDLNQVANAVDRLEKEGKLTEKQSESLSRSLIRAGNSAGGAADKAGKLNSSLIAQRYALYDVATTYGAYAAAVTGAGVATVAAFASQERAFTDVERTADGALGNIRDRLTELSTQIPFSFNQLSQIATLGNQLGIASGDIAAFTETIAQFSTVTGISIDASAQAFGKLGNLLGVGADEYDRLASSITLVGRTTAATEAQIISVASEIAPAAASAGFAADQVIGLSGALASLKVPPERSRSTILQFFETLNGAVAGGGEDLENFAAVVGTTTEQLTAMVRNGQGADILTQFINRVSTADTVQLTQALEALGLAGLRTNPTIRALKDNTDLLSQAMSDGRQGFTENTELQRQMAMVVDDLASKFTMAWNAIQNFAAAVGSQLAPILGPALDILTDVLVEITNFINTPIGGNLTQIVAGIAAVTGVFALYRTAVALSTATTYALITAQQGLAASGATSSLGQLIFGFNTLTGATNAATGATAGLGAALATIGKALGWIGVIALAVQLYSDLGGTVAGVSQVVDPAYQGWINLAESLGVVNLGADLARAGINDLGSALAAGLNMVADFVEQAQGAASTIAGIVNIFGGPVTSMITAWVGLQDGLGVLPKTLRNMAKGIQTAGKATKENTATNKENTESTQAAAAGFQGLGDAAAGAAAKVYTLTDYANDLASIWDRAFEIRFSGQSTLDTITQSFIDIRDRTEEARRNIQSLRADLMGLESQLSTQQYFLGIALEYSDYARAEAIQANIAKLQAEIADKTAALSDAQAANSKELTGNSKAAIANRKTITDLVAQYQSHIKALAASGMSADDLARRTEELRQDFVNQAVQLGYSRAELGQYEQAFYDVATAIRTVPRNVTVDFDGNAALTAAREFKAKLQEALNAGGAAKIPIGTSFDNTGAAQSLIATRDAYRAQLLALYDTLGGNSNVNTGRLEQAIRRLNEQLRSMGYAQGGYTGRGGMYQPAGIVHRGEYVIPKRDVNQRTGLPYADALGRHSQGRSGARGYAQGGYVQGAGGGFNQVDRYGPLAVQQMAQVFQQIFNVDGKMFAQAMSAQAANETNTGAW